MLSIDQIQNFFPPSVTHLRKSMLREYLQCKILAIIFRSKFSEQLSFLGGTALRLVHNNTRFSEDLDFDNFSLTTEEFIEISEIVKSGLEAEGCKVEVRNVFKGAFRCFVKLPGILYENNLTDQEGEKLLIQFDTVPHNFAFKPESFSLDRFDVNAYINVTPRDLLLSQKICAAFGRKTAKGRDFYDLVFLFTMGVRPNFDYLKGNLKIENVQDLKSYIVEHSLELDFHLLAEDVRQFLFNPADSQKVENFLDYAQNLEF